MNWRYNITGYKNFRLLSWLSEDLSNARGKGDSDPMQENLVNTYKLQNKSFQWKIGEK